jgi:Spy/CpxP family protein refolding chaperone
MVGSVAGLKTRLLEGGVNRMNERNQKIGKLGVALAVALLVPVALAAQQHGHNMQDSSQARRGMMGMGGMMGMMGMMQGNDMMGMSSVMTTVMRLQPRQVLAYADTLKLTDEQISHIKQLEAAQQTNYQEHMNNMMGDLNTLSELLEADQTDVSKVEAEAERVMKPYHAMAGSMIVDAARVKNELTPDQRKLALDLPIRYSGMMMHGNRGAMNPGGGHGQHD